MFSPQNYKKVCKTKRKSNKKHYICDQNKEVSCPTYKTEPYDIIQKLQ